MSLNAKDQSNAIMYIRVSSKNQVEYGDSLDGQKVTIEKWAKLNNFKIVKAFIDEGASAYKGRRLIFDSMLEHAIMNSTEIDAILVYNLSRFSRTQLKRMVTEEALDKVGISVFSATEPLPKDKNQSYLMRNVLGMINEFSSIQNSAVVTDRMADTVRKGYYPGAPVPFGYKSIPAPTEHGSKSKKVLVVEPSESSIVKMMFELCLKGISGKGLGLKGIALTLNSRGQFKRGKSGRQKTLVMF